MRNHGCQLLSVDISVCSAILPRSISLVSVDMSLNLSKEEGGDMVSLITLEIRLVVLLLLHVIS